MSFTTLKFILFFAAVLLGYYLLPGRVQKLWLLATSYAFYVIANGTLALLLLLGTAASYLAARAMERWPARRKLFLVLGVGYTLGMLFVFKYFNFFYASVAALFGGQQGGLLELALPLGISFFSFSVAGYLFDVARGKLSAERDFINWAVFVAFFPTLLSGPIGKAREFLPQLARPVRWDALAVRRGLLRFVWGAFKKMVLADTLAQAVNTAWADPSAISGGAMLAAVLLYSLQLYFDFAAYSDMAVGTAQMLGLCIQENFRAPYFSRSIKEFWKKWHRSLIDWFREYLYFPLGGSRKGTARTRLNVLIVFLVSGLWHGAAVTYLVWGLINGLYQVVGSMTEAPRRRLRDRLHIREESPVLAVWQAVCVFLLLSAARIFFRAGSMDSAVYVIKHILLILRDGVGAADVALLLTGRQAILLGVCLIPCIWEDVCIARGRAQPDPARSGFRFWGAITVLLLMIAVFGIYGEGFDAQEFVYFRF